MMREEAHGPDWRLFRSGAGRPMLSLWGFPRAWEYIDDPRRFEFTFEVRSPGMVTVLGEARYEGQYGADAYLTAHVPLSTLLERLAGPNPQNIELPALIWRGGASAEYKGTIQVSLSPTQLTQLRVFFDEAAGQLSGLAGRKNEDDKATASDWAEAERRFPSNYLELQQARVAYADYAAVSRRMGNEPYPFNHWLKGQQQHQKRFLSLDAQGRDGLGGGLGHVKLSVGMLFDTPYEKGCRVLSLPNAQGAFIGLDSDGVEVEFHIGMVTRTYPAGASALSGLGYLPDQHARIAVAHIEAIPRVIELAKQLIEEGSCEEAHGALLEANTTVGALTEHVFASKEDHLIESLVPIDEAFDEASRAFRSKCVIKRRK